jgi:hypothetical protein
MKKYQYRELILNRLGGGSVTADVIEKYRPGVIDYWIGIAFDDMVVRVFQNSTNPSLSDLDAYTKLYRVAGTIISLIHAADFTGKKYLQIPTISKRLLQIPNNKAIRQIWTVEPYTSPATAPRKCLYREIGMDAVYNQLEVNTYLPTIPRYEIMGENIYFDGKIGEAMGALIYMVVPYSEFEDTDDLPSPLENNDTILEFVFQKMMSMKPEDKIMDDNLVQT